MSQYDIVEQMQVGIKYSVKDIKTQFFKRTKINNNSLGTKLKRACTCGLLRREKETFKNLVYYVYWRVK